MNRTDSLYRTYVEILEKELIPAMGCTEPIAVAYCAAKAGELLDGTPDRVLAQFSGNIIKNVKSVIVPNTGGRKGLETAVAAGLIYGNPELKLQVISQVTDRQKKAMEEYLEKKVIKVEPLETLHPLDILITVYKGESSAQVRITDDHTNIVHMEKDGQVIFHREIGEVKEEEDAEYSKLTMEKIYDFAVTADLEDVKDILDCQITYNYNIAREGLDKDYGANIGKVLLKSFGSDVMNRAKAYAAAGSDARMNGCELPVVINSGSGNQGLTVSLPLIVYARELGASQEALYRALIISNLSAVHLKTQIGRLSAYCGAVSAGASAGAGIAYLKGGDLKVIAHTIVNALAITSGIICDGAKASCAAKISASVDAGILGYEMYMNGQQFYGGDGIISKGIENTIRNIGLLGSVGMVETDKEIIRIMTCVD